MRFGVRGSRAQLSTRIAVLAVLFGVSGTVGAAPLKVTPKLVLLDAPVFCLWAQSWQLVDPGKNELFGRDVRCTPDSKRLLVEFGDKKVGVPVRGKVVNIPSSAGAVLALRFQRVLIPPQWLKAGGKTLAKRWIVFPAMVSRIKLGRDRLDCFDLNGDGRYWRIGEDAIVHEGSRYALPLRDQFIVGRVRYRWRRVDESRLEIVGTESMVGIDGSSNEIDAMCLWNRYRVRAGLPAAWLDPKLSADCAKHCEYLRLNPGDYAHDEDPAKPGFTQEGKAAGLNSCVSHNGNPIAAVTRILSMLYHKRELLSPRLVLAGLAARGGKVVIDGRRGCREGETWTWAQPLCFPAHGQTTAIISYRGTERPIPIPSGGSAGASVLLRFPWHTNIEKASGTMWVGKGRSWTEIETYFSSPAAPANETRTDNSSCIALFPKNALGGRREYKVHVEVWRTGEGAPVNFEWTFRTGK